MAAELVKQDDSEMIIQVKIPLGSNMLAGEELIQEAVNDVGNLATGELLNRFDADGSPISMAGIKLTSKGKVEKCYQTPYGKTSVWRHVYQSSKGGSTFCPLEREARIIGTATPKFAKCVSSKYAENGAAQVAQDLEQNHGRSVARSFVQNLSELVAAGAEAKEDVWSYTEPPLEKSVKTVTVGLDGTCMLMCQGGYRQAMVGTIALYDKDGERLHTLYTACAPEYGKETFLKKLQSAVEATKKRHPNAHYVGVADGAADNWTFLKQHTQIQTLDFWHATEYLAQASRALYSSHKKQEEREQWLDEACHNLKHKQRAAGRLLTEMEAHLESKIPEKSKEVLKSTITYFRNHKHQMHYAKAAERNEPIGSGVTEAACKVIVKQRLCESGMRWKESGASAVLTLRSMARSSGKWEQFWNKVGQYGLAA